MLEMFYKAVMLDFAWWTGAILHNLLWFFIFTALFFYFVGGKFSKQWILFAAEFFTIWALFDVLGLTWFPIAFPFLFFAFHAAMRTLLKNTALEKFVAPISTVFVFASSALIN